MGGIETGHHREDTGVRARGDGMVTQEGRVPGVPHAPSPSTSATARQGDASGRRHWGNIKKFC